MAKTIKIDSETNTLKEQHTSLLCGGIVGFTVSFLGYVS
jgi:hypothetical protein